MILGKGYGASVDWWAAGIVLYELYLDQGTPFDDDDPLQSYKRILEAAAAGTCWADPMVAAPKLSGSVRHVRRRPELDAPRSFVNALCRLKPTEVRADRAGRPRAVRHWLPRRALPAAVSADALHRNRRVLTAARCTLLVFRSPCPRRPSPPRSGSATALAASRTAQCAATRSSRRFAGRNSKRRNIRRRSLRRGPSRAPRSALRAWSSVTTPRRSPTPRRRAQRKRSGAGCSGMCDSLQQQRYSTSFGRARALTRGASGTPADRGRSMSAA